MTRYLILLVASTVAAGALISVDAHTADAQPQMITATKEGKPILLGRMVVTAQALPEQP